RIPKTGSQFEKSLVLQRLIVGDPILISWSPCVARILGSLHSQSIALFKIAIFLEKFIGQKSGASDSAPLQRGTASGVHIPMSSGLAQCYQSTPAFPYLACHNHENFPVSLRKVSLYAMESESYR